MVSSLCLTLAQYSVLNGTYIALVFNMQLHSLN
nr:MAG TPA: hypothetical protein [Caudoviricetes sp.]DAS04803.1 MAG TPA: hypothetical protein [Caudoviricetes sp.]